MTERKKQPPLEMPQRIAADPENIMRKVVRFHAPEGRYPHSEDGRWPHEVEYDKAEQSEADNEIG